MVRISDEQVLELLEENGRVPAARMAEKLGVTETAIRKRMRKLETKGIIQQYTIRVDPKKLGKEVIAMVGIDTTPESYMKIVEDMGKRPEVKAGYTVSGDHMIQLECWFENSEKFKEFMQELEDMKGITRLCPGLVLEKFK